jgi:hypothetical protein
VQVGVIITPRKYIMGKIDERAFKTMVILISAALCILFIGCICILILTNGVSKEMKLRAELISHLDARRRAEASSNYKSQFLANMRSVISSVRLYGSLYYEVKGSIIKSDVLQS